MIANPARSQLYRENKIRRNFPVPVSAEEFGLAKQVRPSRPASARSFSALILNMAHQLLYL